MTGDTTSRGYGTQHQRLRRQVARDVKAGTAICTRCGRPIPPDAPWDLDHSDDRTTYLGPACRSCNRAAGGRKGRRHRASRQSRAW